MTTSLIQLPGVTRRQENQLPSTMTAERIADLIGPYLPRLQLFTANSTVVKERLISAGHWGIPLTPSTIIDLGEEVDVVLAAERDKALLVGDELISSTDKASETFKKIRDLANNDRDSGAMYGTEFLVWIGMNQVFCTLFLGSASARRETLSFINMLDKPAQVFSKLVGQRRKWEVPLIRETEAFPFALPDEATVAGAWTKFTKKDAEVEVAEATTERAR